MYVTKIKWNNSEWFSFELTSEWKRPQVSNLTAKSKGSAASPSCTVLLQLVSWAWPFTYITPWKLGSDTLTVTETPSAKQLTIISGRGKSLGGGLGLGMGTIKRTSIYIECSFFNILKILHSTYIMHIKYSNLVDEIMRLLAAVLYLYYSTNMSALIPKLEIFMASHFSCVLCTYANEMETNAYCISCSSTSVEAEISM